MPQDRRDEARTTDRPRRILRSVALALVVLGPLLAVVATEERASAATCAEPVPMGQIRVVVVVDPGDVGGPSSACLVVPAGTTGSQALARRASDLGLPAPRYGGSGLLCALDGHPVTGCGDRNAGGYLYWAYFNGTSGRWVYGNYNPFIRRLTDGDVEGWRFVDGAGNGADPPPRIGPSPSLFPAIAAPTTVPLTQPPPTLASPTTSMPSTTVPPAVTEESVPDPSPAPTVTPTESVELAVAPVGSRSSVGEWVPVAVIGIVIAGLGVGAAVRSRRRT